MKKLPIGIQDFKKLREQNLLYVDKTQHIHQLVDEGNYFFLARPRRFGKSLLVSTLAELFKGSKKLFDGLWIEDQWDWTQTHPVIEIRFNESAYKDIGLLNDINRRLEEIAKEYEITLSEENYVLRFRELILALSAQFGKVVLLIDEYDKPIIDYLEDIPKAKEQRNILKGFYSVLKPLDANIRFVFLTGVSKFSRVSIFSELNNLLDLTLHSDYADLFGYTQQELEYYFADRIEAIADEFGGKAALLNEIKSWYNGYTWDTTHYVYNPFSILNFFSKRTFQNYWFETGTPTFLIKLLREQGVYDVSHIETSYASFDSYELDRISYTSLLFQTGYLTIKEDLGYGLFVLGYPNKEVRASMLHYLIADYVDGDQGAAAAPALQMLRALDVGNTEQVKVQINAILGAIPYNLHQKNESYYHTVMHLAFSLIGAHVQSEIHVAKGRLDTIVHAKQDIYIFEFKTNSSAEEAMAQIKEMGYAQPYLGNDKPVIGIGVSFNTELREIDSWLVEKLS
ncbi:MAG: AAA family ATPase [Flammeovirgaceae bacterium]